MPAVNAYKCLRIYVSIRLSFVFASKDLVSRAKNALLCIMKTLYMVHNRLFALFLKLFDSQVQPIVLYGHEIWVLDDAAVQCQQIHV